MQIEEFTCKICSCDKPNSIRGLLNHIRTHGITSKEYYDTYHKKPGEGLCKICGKGTKYKSGVYGKYCSPTCTNTMLQSEGHKLLVSERFRSDDRDERLIRFRKNRGKVDPNAKKALETKTKRANDAGLTLFEYLSRKSKTAAAKVTKEQKHKQVLKAMETKARNKSGSGVKGNTYKDYMLGESLYRVQGYEPIIIDAIRKHVNDSDITLPGKHDHYIYIDSNGVSRMYFPDIIIKDANLIIEVKSGFTYNAHKTNTELKLSYCRKRGFKTLLIILNARQSRNGELEGFEKLLDLAISSQASKANEFRYEEGSTTSRLDVGSSDPKCLGS